jgi:putative SOS response-associated peptidase YedK
MCGRFTLRSPNRIEASARWNAPTPLSEPRFNIAPGQDVLTVMSDDGERALMSARWGLIPSWSKVPKGFINARSETLEQKPSFSESFDRRRCLIPADGFYEWKRAGKTKQPYYFQLWDEAPFYFAGIWDQWRRGDESITSCAIITTRPNELLETIHDRMPVILPTAAEEVWLGSDTPLVGLLSLLTPFPASAMKCYAVSEQVNRAQAEDAQLAQPMEVSDAGTNLSLF